MVWIIVMGIVVVVIGLGALAWWSSGRAKPLGRSQPRGMTGAEKNAHYEHNQAQARWSGGGPGIT
jgi:hypothetical protein